MNRKTRKRLFINSKNHMIANGYKPPKWKLMVKKWPTYWINTNPTLLEASWVIDMWVR